VIESSDLEHDLPPQYVRALGVTQVICTPMVARGRWVGVILADRAGVGAPVDDGERETLWVLGKTVALAAMARVATRQQERALQLEQRIEMARNIHDQVIQRLFGLSLALSSGEPLDDATRARSASELQAAVADLRSALVQPLGQALPAATTTLGDELERLTRSHPTLRITFDREAITAPPQLEALAQAVLVEAVRNAQRHASPTNVSVATTIRSGMFQMDVVNDGAHDESAGGTGMGLRVAGFAALQAGGLLEFGRMGGDIWRVRLLVPTEH